MGDFWSIPELPGVMDPGIRKNRYLRRAKPIALQVLADMIESGDGLTQSVPGPLRRNFI